MFFTIYQNWYTNTDHTQVSREGEKEERVSFFPDKYTRRQDQEEVGGGRRAASCQLTVTSPTSDAEGEWIQSC